MSDDTNWPARCDYEAAIEELECVSRALKASLKDRGPAHYQKLIEAEEVARERVARIRARLISLRRTIQLPRVSERDS